MKKEKLLAGALSAVMVVNVMGNSFVSLATDAPPEQGIVAEKEFSLSESVDTVVELMNSKSEKSFQEIVDILHESDGNYYEILNEIPGESRKEFLETLSAEELYKFSMYSKYAFVNETIEYRKKEDLKESDIEKLSSYADIYALIQGKANLNKLDDSKIDDLNRIACKTIISSLNEESKDMVTDFDTYASYLQSLTTLDVNAILTELDVFSLSNEEELQKVTKEFRNFIYAVFGFDSLSEESEKAVVDKIESQNESNSDAKEKTPETSKGPAQPAVKESKGEYHSSAEDSEGMIPEFVSDENGNITFEVGNGGNLITAPMKKFGSTDIIKDEQKIMYSDSSYKKLVKKDGYPFGIKFDTDKKYVTLVIKKNNIVIAKEQYPVTDSFPGITLNDENKTYSFLFSDTKEQVKSSFLGLNDNYDIQTVSWDNPKVGDVYYGYAKAWDVGDPQQTYFPVKFLSGELSAIPDSRTATCANPGAAYPGQYPYDNPGEDYGFDIGYGERLYYYSWTITSIESNGNVWGSFYATDVYQPCNGGIAGYQALSIGSVGVWRPDISTYKNTIGHWAGMFKNNEGNNTAKDQFSLSTTEFEVKSGNTFIMDAGRKVKVPNGFFLSDTIGTSGITGSWQNYKMGSSLKQPSNNVHFEYYYRPYNYKITYDLDGGTNNPDNPSTYDVLYGVTLKKPTKQGFIFDGWYIDDKKVDGINPGANASFSSATDLYNKLATRTTGDVTLTAKWIPDGTNGIYVDGKKGKDTNDGKTPKTAVKTFKQAYTNAKNRGGIIFVVNEVTIGDNMQLTGTSYQDDTTTINLNAGYEVMIKRYSQPETVTTGFEVGSNGSLLLILKDTKNENKEFTVTLKDIVVDGHRNGVESDINPNVVAPGVDYTNSLVEVNHGTLSLESGAELRNNDGVGICNNNNVVIDGCSIIKNERGIENYGTATINDGLISENVLTNHEQWMEWKGGSGVLNLGTLTMNGGIISKNGTALSNDDVFGDDEYSAGGVLNISEFVMNGGEISGNAAFIGGGIVNGVDCNLTINNGKIINNTSVNNGGGIENQGSLTIKNGEISNNVSKSDQFENRGGGIHNQGNLKIVDGLFDNNISGSNGGAIYNEVTLTIQGGVFSNNTATKDGGGIYNGQDLFIEDGIIDDNVAKNGGGIYNGYNASFIMKKGEIINNGVGNGTGGGIYNGGTLTIENGSISNNNSGAGGAIYNDDTLIVEGGTIKNNSSYNGGGINNHNGTVTLNGGSISNNISRYSGDGIHNEAILEFSGNVKVDLNNDVYLASGKYITITDSLTSSNETIARITPDSYSNGRKVVKVSYDNKVASDEFSYADGAPKFELTPENDFTIRPGNYLDDSANVADTDMIISTPFDVSYNANGKDASNLPETQNSFWMETVALSDKVPTADSFDFESWNMSSEGYDIPYYPSDKVIMTENMTLYAQWKAKPPYIYIDGQYGKDTNDGKTPKTAVKTFKQAYANAKSIGGIIFVVKPVIVSENMTLTSVSYQDDATTINLDDGYKVMIKRYSQPVTVTTGFDIGSNYSSLIFQGSSLNDKELTIALKDIVIDGHKNAVEVDENPNVIAPEVDEAGSIIEVNQGTLLLESGAVLQNNPGVCIENSRNMEINGASIIQNMKGVLNYGSLTMNAGVISKNIPKDDWDEDIGIGSGILNYKRVTMNGGTISENGNENFNGGGIYNLVDYTNEDPGIFMNDGEIINNIAKSGGGIFNDSVNFLTIKNGIISGNTAKAAGGGIYSMDSSTVTIENGTISDNSAVNLGGGIYNESYVFFTMESGTISNNAATDGGGIYNSEECELMINGGEIIKNSAENGAGIYQASEIATITNVVLNENVSSSYGGAVYNSSDASLTLTNSNITANKAELFGGGVFSDKNSKLSISGCEITKNESSMGAGIDVQSKAEAKIDEHTKIVGNIATDAGAGIYNLGTVITESNISGNISAEDGGGVYNDFKSKLIIKDGEINNNTAERNGDGIYNKGTLEFSGNVKVNSNNDVYLDTGKYITITDALTSSNETIARITPNSYSNGRKVVEVAYDNKVASDEFSYADGSLKFELTPENDFTIRPGNYLDDSANVADTDLIISTPYTISYDANGKSASNIPGVQDSFWKEIVTLSDKIPTGENLEFENWNTKADGSATLYNPSDKVVVSEKMTLYAQWKKTNILVEYDGNGATGGTTPSEIVKYGESWTVSENGFTNTPFEFIEWNTKPDGSGDSYKAGSVIPNFTANEQDKITLYAIWEEILKVVYEGNGATEGTKKSETVTKELLDEQYNYTVQKNEAYTDYARDGYAFDGWWPKTQNNYLDNYSKYFRDENVNKVSWDYLIDSATSSVNVSFRSIGFAGLNSAKTALETRTVPFYAQWDEEPTLEITKGEEAKKQRTFYEGQEITEKDLLKGVSVKDLEDDLKGTPIDIQVVQIEYAAGKLVDGEKQPSYVKVFTDGMTDSDRLDTWFLEMEKNEVTTEDGVCHKVTYEVTDSAGNKVQAVGDVYVKYNNAPAFKTAEDRYFTLEEAQAGIITEEVLLNDQLESKAIVVQDEEEGYFVDPGKGPKKVDLLDFDEEEFKNFTESGYRLITIHTQDSYGPGGNGKESTKQIVVYIVKDGEIPDVNKAKEVRFIDEKNYNKNKDVDPESLSEEETEERNANGGLNVNSKWYHNDDYRAEIEGTFNKTNGEKFYFTLDDVEQIRGFIEEHGIGNMKEDDALDKFADEFLN